MSARGKNRPIEVKPYGGSIGAEIYGVDLTEPLDDETFDAVHQAFLDNLVLFFRDQDLTPPTQTAFARRFGELNIYPFVKGLDEQPEVIEIVKEEHETHNFGGVWHSDTTYLEQPPLGTMLHCKEAPPAGGDTMFANMYLAYEALSDGMKEMLDGLIGVNSAELRYAGGRRNMQYASITPTNMESVGRYAEHPVVRTHPETGRKSLFVNIAHTATFKDMSEAESAPILKYLFAHATRPEFTCSFCWEPGSLALWDNRCAQHYAVNDYHGHRRVMHRVTIEGARPV